MHPSRSLEVTTMEIIVVALILVLIVLFAVGVKLHDLKRRREEEAVAVQARVSDALLMDPALSALPLTPTAHVPLWKGTPVTVSVTGAVPRPELREAALALVRQEVARSRPDLEIEDRISVDPAVLSHAA
jgi:hypothetical protein